MAMTTSKHGKQKFALFIDLKLSVTHLLVKLKTLLVLFIDNILNVRINILVIYIFGSAQSSIQSKLMGNQPLCTLVHIS